MEYGQFKSELKGTVPAFIVAFAVLLIVKVFGFTDISWWGVFLPVWIVPAVVAFFLTLASLIYAYSYVSELIGDFISALKSIRQNRHNN